MHALKIHLIFFLPVKQSSLLSPASILFLSIFAFYIIQYTFPPSTWVSVWSEYLVVRFFYGFTVPRVPGNPFIFKSTLLFSFTSFLTRQILTGIKMPSKTPKEWQSHWYRKQTIGTFLGANNICFELWIKWTSPNMCR